MSWTSDQMRRCRATPFHVQDGARDPMPCLLPTVTIKTNRMRLPPRGEFGQEAKCVHAGLIW